MLWVMRMLLLGACMAVSAAGWQTEAESRTTLDQRGREALAAGRYRDARSYFERVQKLPGAADIERAAALSHAGQACLALGDYRVAEEYWREAIALAPDVAKLTHGLGQALFLQGRYREAEAAYRRAMADAATAADVRGDLAALLVVQKRHAEAAELWREAIATASKGQARARLIRNLGVLEWKMGNRREAVRHLHEAVVELEAAVGGHHPDMAQLLMDYSDALAGIGHRAQARDAATRAQAIRSSFAGQDGAGTVDWRQLGK